MYCISHKQTNDNGSENGHQQPKQLKRRSFSDDGKIINGAHNVQATNDKDHDHDPNLWSIYADGACTDLYHCIAIKRIICALKWYSNANGDADVLWKKIKDQQYGSNLINDYHHIMKYHVTSLEGDLQLLQKEKMAICELIYQSISKCDPHNCLGYKRKEIERLEQKRIIFIRKYQKRASSSSLHNAQSGHTVLCQLYGYHTLLFYAFIVSSVTSTIILTIKHKL